MNLSLKSAALLLSLTLGGFASAETLTGTVKNGTTDKPGSGDEVVLIKLGNGMEEAARTKADAKGNFKFDFDDAGPHLIRAIHQGVTYHRMAPPGTTSVEIEVFDVSKKIEGLSVTADVMRCQVENGQLEIDRIFAVNNESKPPRTQMNDHNFEFYVPEGAKVLQGAAKTANGNPLNSAPVPQADKGRYAFIFPLRPGETQFQVQYALPYSGSATITPKPVYGLQHFVVMIPKSMQFEPGPGAHFETITDPQQADATVQVASNPGDGVSFKISGSGMLAANTAPEGSSNGGAMGGGAGGSGDSRGGPGGGLGPPSDAPDPLQKYRWWIIGGFAVLLCGGAYYVATRQPATVAVAGGPDVAMESPELPAPVPSRPARVTAPITAPVQPARTATAAATAVAAPAATTPRPSMLLEALKEEIFQLEVEHKQGKISQQEYEKAKAALDGTLERAIKRDAQKV